MMQVPHRLKREVDVSHKQEDRIFNVALTLIVVLKVVTSLLVLAAQYSGKISRLEALLLLR